jgi:hypothetical protein
MEIKIDLVKAMCHNLFISMSAPSIKPSGARKIPGAGPNCPKAPVPEHPEKVCHE